MKLAADVVRALLVEAHTAAPAECCGLLGEREGVVRTAYPLHNRSDEAHRFRVGRVDHLRARFAMWRAGERFAAIYHSHPTGKARLSDVDIDFARHRPTIAHLIVSLTEQTVRAFRVSGGEAAQVPLAIER